MGVVDWLGRRAQYTPDREGLVILAGAQQAGAGQPGAEPWRLTFDQWNRRANQMAHYLVGQGVTKGDRVGVLAQNCVEVLDLLFACGKLGAIFVPFNWRLVPLELAPLIADVAPKVIFHGPQFEAPALGSIPLLGLDLGAEPECPPPPVAIDLEDPWMILFTGGTTGRSKGAVLSHRQITWNALNTIAGWGLSPDDRVPLLTPFFHTGGLNVFTTPLVHLGGTSILMGPFDPGQLLQVTETERLTAIFMVPTMFQMVMDHPDFATANFSRIKFFISGGAPCPRQISEAYWAKGAVFKGGYGMTEVGPNCFVMPDHAVKQKVGSVGLPISHVEMRIMNEERSCNPNEVGELQIAGPTLCSGYWQNPEATQASNPDGWFRTGDLAYRDDDGFYYIVDRKKEMFISGGENIYPVEIETALYQHPTVVEAAVLGVPDPKWGEVGKAYVVLKVGASATEAELLDHCRWLLATYKVPKSIEFRSELPKSAAGKVLKRELRT
jgi:fatty-acyl-CoA synthase